MDASKVCIALVLREKKINMAKDRVNNTGFNVLDKGTKTIRVQDIEYMNEKSIQGEIKGSVIFTCELEALGTGNSMEQVNEFMGDCIIFIEGVVFQEEKKVGGVKHSTV